MSDDHATLKSLNVELDRLNNELNALKTEQQNTSRKINELTRRSDEVKKEIQELTIHATKIVVSEHALLRYIERILKIDLEAIKQEMLTDKVVTQAKHFGSGKFPVQHGDETYWLVVKKNVVVTILNNEYD